MRNCCTFWYITIHLSPYDLRSDAAFPATFISTLAGLALLSTIAGILANALSDNNTREAAMITFLATAANINLFGIGGAFWGLVLGLISYFILNGKFKIK